MQRTAWGTMPDGRPVEVLTIGSAPGLVLEVLTLGATAHRLEVTGGDGVRRNVLLGHASVEDRLESKGFVGATIGRFANRIADGRFELDGHAYQLRTNDRGHCLHGGPEGFDRAVWEVLDHQADSVVLGHVSPDGDMGFPGELTVRATYRIVGDDVAIDLDATTDAPTVVNLTNHAYFNLEGDGAGTVDRHVVSIAADEFTPTGATAIPLGGHRSVESTPFDFREPRELGPAVRDPHEQVRTATGIDHNFVIRGEGLRRAATVHAPSTATTMEVWSDQPGLQVYTGNFLDGTSASTDQTAYRQGDGIALEPQLFPDTPNRPEWPSGELRPGEGYAARIVWRFVAG